MSMTDEPVSRIEPDGEGGQRIVHECQRCHGSGDDPNDTRDCPRCEGLGEWFE